MVCCIFHFFFTQHYTLKMFACCYVCFSLWHGRYQGTPELDRKSGEDKFYSRAIATGEERSRTRTGIQSKYNKDKWRLVWEKQDGNQGMENP